LSRSAAERVSTGVSILCPNEAILEEGRSARTASSWLLSKPVVSGRTLRLTRQAGGHWLEPSTAHSATWPWRKYVHARAGWRRPKWTVPRCSRLRR